MPPKKIQIVHPMNAIDALRGYHEDVASLVMAVTSACAMMTDESVNKDRLCTAIAPELLKAVKEVRKWWAQ